MSKKTINVIMKKRLKWHKTEIVLLYLLIAIGAILIPAGIGVYYYVGELTITQQVSTIPTKNFMIAQVKMLCGFAKALGIVFSLVGIASIIFALDRLSFARDAYRMALFIKRGFEESK